MREIFAILQNVTAKIAETGKFTLTVRTGRVNFAAGEFRRSDGFEHVKTGTVTVTAKSISSASNATQRKRARMQRNAGGENVEKRLDGGKWGAKRARVRYARQNDIIR